MKVLLDTNVLVAALVREHPHHGDALPWLQRIIRNDVVGAVSVHSLAEVYTVLTKALKTPAAVALQMIETNILDHFEIVGLDGDDYHNLLKHCVSLNVGGPKVYDALIGWAAWKANVDFLVTKNKKDFDALYPDTAHQIVDPATP
jgi:predicted nucleic acid-binding protein